MKTSVSVLHKATTNLLSVHRHTHTVCACSRCCLGVFYGFLLVLGDQYCQICFDNVLAVFAISNTNKGAFAEKRRGSPLIKAVTCTPVTDRVVESILDCWNSTYKTKPQKTWFKTCTAKQIIPSIENVYYSEPDRISKIRHRIRCNLIFTITFDAYIWFFSPKK